MSEEKNIEEQPEDHGPPTTDDGLKSADETSSPEENKIVPDETLQLSEGIVLKQTANYKLQTPKLQTPGMEVHHHGHVSEKKKWKEYVFQFFMLFLAVFCGFLAENYREHYVEQERAHRLGKALFSNLAYDTSKLGFITRLRAEAVTNNKLLIEELSKPEQKQNNILLQKISASLGNHLYFLPYSGTFEQIKNSGALRYFPDSISQALTAYEQAVKQNALAQNLEQNYITTSLQPFILENINFKNTSSFIDTTDNFDPVLIGNISSKNALLLHSNTEKNLKNIDNSSNPLFKKQLYSFATNSLRFNRFELWEYQSLQHQAIAIMKLLKKEYHLK